MSTNFDLADIKRRMTASIGSLRHDLNGLRTGRATASIRSWLTIGLSTAPARSSPAKCSISWR